MCERGPLKPPPQTDSGATRPQPTSNKTEMDKATYDALHHGLTEAFSQSVKAMKYPSPNHPHYIRGAAESARALMELHKNFKPK